VKKLLFALLISGCVAVCSAANIYNNLADDPGIGDWVANCVPQGNSCQAGSWGPIYNSFSTTATSSAITDVAVTLTTDGDIPPGAFSVGIYADSGSNTPGSLVANGLLTPPVVGDPDAVIGAGPTTLDFSGLNVAVSASSRYWIGIAQVGGGTSAIWDYDFNPNPPDEYISNGTGTFPTSSETPYIMSVSDQYTPGPPPSTPEPAAVLLVGGALMALGLVRRKKA
jgi:hypothetical protein